MRAVQAGADLILLPPQTTVAIQAVARAVREGALTEARIDASVLRILEAKERLGLAPQPAGRPGRRPQGGRPAGGRGAARSPSRAARITVVQQRRGRAAAARGGAAAHPAPRDVERRARRPARRSRAFPEAELAARRIPTETMWLGPEVVRRDGRAHPRALRRVHARAGLRVREGRRLPRQRGHVRGARALLSALAAAGRKLVVVSFGSPYLLRQFPEVPAYVCSYGWAETSQRAAMAALFGEYAMTGRLPVTLPGLYA